MLLIIFLCLIAKLASVCDGCDLGLPTMNNFDWNQFSGNRTWYFKLHRNIKLMNIFDCPQSILGKPVSGVSTYTARCYSLSLQLPVTGTGTARNWNSSGYFEASNSMFGWKGVLHVIATDYNSYVIYKVCDNFSSQLSLYGGYRSPHPDVTTVNVVKTELQKNNIEASQLFEWPVNHCQ